MIAPSTAVNSCRAIIDMAVTMGHRLCMWSLSQPSAEDVREFLEAQASTNFSYREVGSSRNEMPAGYNLDYNRVQLGHGHLAFDAACAALRAWKMFPEPWTKILPRNAPIKTGTTVAMLAQVYGFWWLNACRIVYIIDEATPLRRFGFAYGTLAAHVEKGEERFLIEWLPDDSVWYDLRAFSQPRYWPVRLFKPLARAQQRRFAVESKASMQRAVTEALVR